MIMRRGLLVSSLALATAFLTAPRIMAQDQEPPKGPPPPPKNAVLKGVVAVTRVFGDGQRLVAVALAYDRLIRADSVREATIVVEGRTVTRAYASIAASPAPEGRDGNFVIAELSPDDPGAALWEASGQTTQRSLARARVHVTGTLTAVEGTEVPPMTAPVETNLVCDQIVDDFRQGHFSDAGTGLTLGYNLFIPRDYDPTRSYPLVLFMHDAGVTSPVLDSTLVQGLGAVSFASPEDQEKHPAFVLAPQFDVQIVNDASEATAHLDATINLVKSLMAQYRLDPRRIYATGQSGGGMMSIAMNIKYPDFFAASLLVACQWDAALCKPLAAKKLWVVVAQGDTKAYPGQNAILKVLEGERATVARAVWDGRASPEKFAADVAELEAQGAQINYSAFSEGSVALPGQSGGGSDHMGTWRIAYGIDGLRDWLLRQTA